MNGPQGIARQRQAIVNGLRESVVQFSEQVNDISSRDVIELMMITQYFDTIKVRDPKRPSLIQTCAPGKQLAGCCACIADCCLLHATGCWQSAP